MNAFAFCRRCGDVDVVHVNGAGRVVEHNHVCRTSTAPATKYTSRRVYFRARNGLIRCVPVSL